MIDLPFLPQHPGALHNDLPKAGCKRRVYHKLRPELGNEWLSQVILLSCWVNKQHKLPRTVFGAWQ